MLAWAPVTSRRRRRDPYRVKRSHELGRTAPGAHRGAAGSHGGADARIHAPRQPLARARSATYAPFERSVRQADTSLVSDRSPSNRTFLLSATVISILVLGAWFAWIAHQPACGPPGNTRLAHIDRWAPLAFIILEFAALSVVGLLLKRTLVAVAVTLVTIGGLAVLCGALIAFVIAARGGCFS